jgi:hypothetical protein
MPKPSPSEESLALRLTDAQLQEIMCLSQPLPLHCRDALLRILAYGFDAPNLDGAEETPQPRRLARGGKYR